MTEKTRLEKLRWPIVLALAFLAIIIVIYLCLHEPVTTVLIVRHAEKENVVGSDPPLSLIGQQRAQDLLHSVGESGIEGIYATQYLRTQQTVQPTADQLGLSINQIDAASVNGLINSIFSDHSGGVVLVAGHSNTVPQIIEALGGDSVPSISESEFDNLYVVIAYRHWWDWRANVTHLNYGAPD